jgi:hypothetical protein
MRVGDGAARKVVKSVTCWRQASTGPAILAIDSPYFDVHNSAGLTQELLGRA